MLLNHLLLRYPWHVRRNKEVYFKETASPNRSGLDFTSEKISYKIEKTENGDAGTLENLGKPKIQSSFFMFATVSINIKKKILIKKSFFRSKTEIIYQKQAL